MARVFTTGVWRPKAGEEDAFLEEWRHFMEWAASMPGAGIGRLTRDLRDPGRFVSFASWESIEAVRGWKDSAEFKPRMSRVQQHVAEFAPTEIEVVAEIGSATAET